MCTEKHARREKNSFSVFGDVRCSVCLCGCSLCYQAEVSEGFCAVWYAVDNVTVYGYPGLL